MNGTTCNLSPSWLEEISDNVKPTVTMTLFGTLLGSAVISAVVSWGASYALETHRDHVERAKIQAINTTRSLETLSNHLGTLNLQLENLVSTNELVSRYRSNSNLLGYTNKSLGQVGEQIPSIYADVKNPQIGNDIAKHTTEILDALGPRLEQAQRDVTKIRGLVDLYRTVLQTRLHNIQSEIHEAIRLTRL